MGRARVEGFRDPRCLRCVRLCVSVCVYLCQMECLQHAATIYEGRTNHVTSQLSANVILQSHNESVGSVTEQKCVLLCDMGHWVPSILFYSSLASFYKLSPQRSSFINLTIFIEKMMLRDEFGQNWRAVVVTFGQKWVW